MLRTEQDLDVVVVDDLDRLPDARPLHAVVLHQPAEDVVASATRCSSPAPIVVVVHDGLPPSQRASLQFAGADVLVDSTSAPALLIAAVRGEHKRSLRRWEPARLGHVPLSPRERDVVSLLANGRTSAEIAHELGISAHTVENHKQRVFRRLGVQNQAQAVAIAVRDGLIDAPVRWGR